MEQELVPSLNQNLHICFKNELKFKSLLSILIVVFFGFKHIKYNLVSALI